MSALGCGITATGLRANGILFCESESVVCELTVSTGIDRDIVHELLLVQRQQIDGGEEPSTVEATRGRERPIRVTLPLGLH